MADKTYQTTLLIRGDSKDAVKQVQLTRDELERLTGVQQKNATMADRLQGAYKGVGIGLAAISGIGVAALYKMVEETSASDAAMAQLNATLKATGGAAGKTSEDLAQTAGRLQAITTYSDEAVVGAQSLLLAFKNIKGDTFDRATESALDLSQALGKDLNASSILVGKALDNPVKGMTALSKIGVTFTEGQKETIRAMVETGDVAGAQALILQELEGRYKGSAEAARDTLGGALKGLSNSWGELFEVQQQSSGGMVQSINDLNAAISDPAFKEGIQTLIGGLIDVVGYGAQAIGMLNNLGQAIGQFAADFAQGTASTAEGVADLKGELAEYEKRLSLMDQSSRRAAPAVAELKGKIAELKQAISVSETFLVKNTAATNDNAKASGSAAKSTAANTAATTASGKAAGVATSMTDSLADANRDNASAQLLSQKTLKAMADEQARATAEKEKTRKAIAGLIADEMKATKQVEDYIAALEYEIRATQMSAREQAIENAVRQAGTDISEAQEQRIRELAAAKYDNVTASEALADAEQEAAQASSQAWQSARDTLSSFFFEMAADGKNAFETLVDGFRAMISKMLAEAAANKILLAVGITAPGAAISGVASAATGGGTSVTGGASFLSSLSGGITAGGQALYESIGNLASNAGLTGIGDAAYTKGLNTSPMSMGLDLAGGFAGSYLGSKAFGETSGLGATAGGIAGSFLIPIPGLGAAIGAFVGSGLEKAFNKVFGQKNDGSNKGQTNFDLATGANNASGIGKTFNQENVDAASNLATVLQEFATSIGGSNLAANITVGGKEGIKYGGTAFGSDTERFLQTALKDVFAASDAVSDQLKPLIKDFDGTAEEIAAFAQAMVALDEQAGGLSETTLTLIRNYAGAAEKAGEYAVAIASIEQMAGVNTVTKAIEDFARVQPSAAEAYRTHTEGLLEQIRAYDGTAEASTSLAQTLTENKAAAYEYAVAIQGIGKSLADAAAGQAMGIRESVMSEEELRSKRLNERDTLRASLETMTDPAEVERTQRRILQLNDQVFYSLDEKRRGAEAESYASFAEDTNDIAQGILKAATDDLVNVSDSINAQLEAMLTTAAQGQQKAADTQQDAADLMVQAAASMNAAADRIEARVGREID